MRPRDHARRRPGRAGPRRQADDVFSRGFLCPKGVALKAHHEDPERLRTPLVKQADGTHAEATWEEAFALIAERLPAIQAEHGRDAVGIYLGNPSVHSLAGQLYGRVLIKALQTKSIFSASTVDQYPKQAASGLMFGSALAVPVPDLDRTDYLLMLGANPAASNGSLMTAPDARGRIAAISARGGKVVVVDPRRTRSAKLADEHLWIRPGTDALFLFALVHVIFAEGLGQARRARSTASRSSRRWPATSPPRPSRAPTGVPADTSRGGSRGSWRPRRAPPSTGASARRRRRSGRPRAGWSTSSTRSPATSTGRAARCGRCRRPRSAGRAAGAA